jgi:hypothetical protein
MIEELFGKKTFLWRRVVLGSDAILEESVQAVSEMHVPSPYWMVHLLLLVPAALWVIQRHIVSSQSKGGKKQRITYQRA